MPSQRRHFAAWETAFQHFAHLSRLIENERRGRDDAKRQPAFKAAGQHRGLRNKTFAGACRQRNDQRLTRWKEKCAANRLALTGRHISCKRARFPEKRIDWSLPIEPDILLGEDIFKYWVVAFTHPIGAPRPRFDQNVTVCLAMGPDAGLGPCQPVWPSARGGYAQLRILAGLKRLTT